MGMYDTFTSGVCILGNSDLEADFELNTSSKCDKVAKKTVTVLYLKGGNYWAEKMVLPHDGLLMKVHIQFIHLYISNNVQTIGKIQKRTTTSFSKLENLPNSESKEAQSI